MKISFSVDMAENTILHAVLFHDGKNVHGAAVVIVGRIMENAKDAGSTGLCSELKAPFQPAFLPLQNGCIFFREGASRFGNPASRSGKRYGAHFYGIVMKKFKGSVCSLCHFGYRVPPVIVVAPDDNFPSRQGGEPLQVRQGICQVATPGEVARDNNRILRTNHGQPGLADFPRVIFPVRAEYVHGLCLRIAGEMEITECK